MRHLINNMGNTHDVKCSLDFINPKTPEETRSDIELIELSIKDEKMFRNRKTVLNLLESKLKKLQKSIS